ncbi:hypothetical protein ACFXJ8_43260 [Nonomuraea sp. NPDC059194]|uniref:hypothetical protein n=1 Tax=Nonomuraea sp. NPDC059194 TaxID=3346764 RepID=UPI0036763474
MTTARAVRGPFMVGVRGAVVAGGWGCRECGPQRNKKPIAAVAIRVPSAMANAISGLLAPHPGQVVGGGRDGHHGRGDGAG